MAERSDIQENKLLRGSRGNILLPAVYACVEGIMLVLLKILEFAGGHAHACTALMYGAIVLNTLVLVWSLSEYARCAFPRGKLTETEEYTGNTASGQQDLQRKLTHNQGSISASREGLDLKQPVNSGSTDGNISVWAGLFTSRVLPNVGFTACALLFTLAADTILTLLDRWYLAGVLLFCIVQTFYALAMKPSRKAWGIRLGIFLVIVIALIPMHMAQALNIASAYSIAMLTLNALAAWMLWKNSPQEARNGCLLFALGLTLFWGCDMSVGIFNLSYGVQSLHTVYEISGFLMWFFYLPGQVLLVFAERAFLCREYPREA